MCGVHLHLHLHAQAAFDATIKFIGILETTMKTRDVPFDIRVRCRKRSRPCTGPRGAMNSK